MLVVGERKQDANDSCKMNDDFEKVRGGKRSERKATKQSHCFSSR